jgi:hypothetical protein
MADDNFFEGRYEFLVSVEYKDNFPFARTFIVELDHVKGKRETCLFGKSSKINSEECRGIELLSERERKYAEAAA